MFSEMFRLWEKSARAPVRGLSCDKDGVFLGGHCALVTPEHDGSGRPVYRVRPVDEINRILSAGYGFRVDFTNRLNGLRRAAEYMTAGDWAMAQLVALHLRVPDLPDGSAVARLRKAVDNSENENHPHWPAGEGRRSGEFRPKEGDDATESPAPPTDVPSGANLPPGEYRADLKDLLERIANAKPEDEHALRLEINQRFAAVGDLNGAIALQNFLGQVLHSDGSLAARQEILNSFASYAKTNPENVGAFWNALSFALRPTKPIEVYRWGRRAAIALADALGEGATVAADRIRRAIEESDWLSGQLPNVLSSLDPPKDLDELIEAAEEPGSHPGYERHHIVEQNQAENGISPDRIDSRENTVLIPYYKHRDISNYF